MAPCRPREDISQDNPAVFFNGGLIFELIEPPPPDRCFMIKATFSHHQPKPSGPPRKTTDYRLHFHPFQVEYFKVISGSLSVLVNGIEHTLTESSPEFRIPNGAIHWPYVTPGSTEDAIVMGSADTGGAPYQLDWAFFQNWLQYANEAMKHGEDMDYIQVLSMWDAGDCVLPFKSLTWLPFANLLARWRGVIIGRWVGGALGYQPFYKAWTRDWEQACQKMRSSPFQRRFSK